MRRHIIGFRILADEQAATEIAQAKRKQTALLLKILRSAVVTGAFNKLCRAGCNREHLEIYVTEEPEMAKRATDAEGRKAVRSDYRSLLVHLDKARRLAVKLDMMPPSDATGRPLPRLDAILPAYISEVRASCEWARLKPLFTRRQSQQMAFVSWVSEQTGRPHYPEVAKLLSASYEEYRLPVKEFPTAESLRELYHRLRRNRAAWQRSRQNP